MRVSEIDALRLRAGEAEASQARGEIGRRFVRERFAEGEAERGRAAFLDRVPRVFDARGWVLLFDDESAAGTQPRTAAQQERVPFVDWDFVEDVDDRDRVEGTGDDVVESD